MPANNHLSRRHALAGLGAGSLGLLLGSHASALPDRETGSAPGGADVSMATHLSTGRWLSAMGLPSKPNDSVAVPSFSVQSNDHFFTVRDEFSAIVEHLASSITNPMRGFRMRAGNAGFPDPDAMPERPDDPRTPY
jgi:hypothetical protein